MDPSTGFLRHRATFQGGAKEEDGNHGGRAAQEEEVQAKLTVFRSRARTISQVVTAQKIVLIFSFVFLSFSILPVYSQNEPGHTILFDEVGQMAVGMSVIHVAIPINLTHFQEHAQQFQTHLELLAKQTVTGPKRMVFVKQIVDIATFAQKRLARISDQIFLLDNILPQAPANDNTERFIRSTTEDLNSNDTFSTQEYFAFLTALQKELEPRSRKTRSPSHPYRISALERKIQKIEAINQMMSYNISELYNRSEWAANIIHHINVVNLININDFMEKQKISDREHISKSILEHNLVSNKLAFITHKLNRLDSLEKEMAKIIDIHFPQELRHLLQSIQDPVLRDSISHLLSSSEHETSPHLRRKRFVLAAIALISGVLGTFMGLYNAHEMNNLQKQLNSLAAKHNFLVLATKQQQEHITELTQKMIELAQLIEHMTVHNPALIANQIEEQLNIFQNRLNTITNGIQQLQHHRLSVDLLTFKQLSAMHSEIIKTAKVNGYAPLTNQLSDYFQLETSFLRQGSTIIILIHVPCVAKNQLLNIYRYVPFPFPMSKSFDKFSTTIQESMQKQKVSANTQTVQSLTSEAIYIKPESSLIAIGPDSKYIVLSQADITHCVQKNRIFLCEKHQVLKKNLIDSCLGSLYLRAEEGVKQHCKLEIRKLDETVYQLDANNHLVFSPTPLTTQIKCRNGTHYPVFLSQTTKLSVPNGCETDLRQHFIKSDFNIKVSPAALHFQWQIDLAQFPATLLLDAAKIDQQMFHLTHQIEIMKNNSITLQNFDQMMFKNFSNPTTVPIVIWLSFALSFLLVLLILGWCIFSRWQAVRYYRRKQEMEMHPLGRAIAEHIQHPTAPHH